MIIQKIKIPLVCQPPQDQVRNRKRFRWLDQNIEGTEYDHQQSIDIFGDSRVIGILSKAFELGLNRREAWDITDVNVDLKPAVVKAATYFKRGVSVVDSSSDIDRWIEPFMVPPSMNPSREYYEAILVTQIEDCFVDLQSRDLVIVDANVSKDWHELLPSGHHRVVFTESSKNYDGLTRILRLMRSHPQRDSRVWVVGGGVAGDMVGLAASIAGHQFIFVPTTFLAMVDSSVGGKVGINVAPWGKNQLGQFATPQQILLWSGWLKTLNNSEIKSGATEALKHTLISGNAKAWQQIIADVCSHDWNKLCELLPQIITVKRDIVAKDMYEQGERMILNLGHTLGHALESLAFAVGHRVTHGECVAIGLVHALRISQKYLGMNAEPWTKDILKAGVIPHRERLVTVWGTLPQMVQLKTAVMTLMLGDKKNSQSVSTQMSITYVLLNNFGQPHQEQYPVEAEQAWLDVLETWSALLGQ